MVQLVRKNPYFVQDSKPNAMTTSEHTGSFSTHDGVTNFGLVFYQTSKYSLVMEWQRQDVRRPYQPIKKIASMSKNVKVRWKFSYSNFRADRIEDTYGNPKPPIS